MLKSAFVSIPFSHLRSIPEGSTSNKQSLLWLECHWQIFQG